MAGHRLNRQRFPPGMEGEELVIDSRTPSGLTWSPRGVGFDHPNADTDAATKGYADGAAGLITGSGTASTGAMTSTTWTPVPSGGTHVLASDSSDVFTLVNYGVMKYTGTPTIVVEFTCTGSIVKLATAGTQAIFIGVGKRNAAAPVAASIQINLSYLSVETIGVHYPISMTWVTQLATNDHIAPMFLAFLTTPTLNLAQTQTYVRSIREV